ncbi:hypothetical protein BN1723_002586 [Verticillium longisporum]|uniref:WH1 domain-containing protein n=1 Tax=Verticillium longisporum TaxID=100787 RepID=A0A0G4LCI1_VERLO|nr:hypothetical protein BN1723_002586 [Verticillium longisporum]
MPSILNDDDKDTVKRHVPKQTNKIQAVAVARLYVAYPDRTRWNNTGLQGAIVLSNDLVGNTYWLKLVDVSAATLSGNTPSGMHRLLKEPTERLTPIVNMVRLRDPTLVATTVQVVVRLLVRLRENDHEIPQSSREFIHNVCTKGPDGRYITPSNATSQQRAELLKALGEEEEDDVEVISIQPASAATKKKQTSLDAWSKSGSSGSSSAVSKSRSNKDDVLSLSSSVDKNRSLLDKISARQSAMAKPKPLPLKAKIDPSSTKALIESRKAAKAEKAKRDAEAIAKAQALRGPEIKGLSGVVGKDHAPSKNEIMVDSDDDESSDDSEDEDEERRAKAAELNK